MYREYVNHWWVVSCTVGRYVIVYTHACMHTLIHIHIKPHTHTYTHTYTYIYIHIYIHTHTYINININTHMHAHAYTHTHTYMQAHSHIYTHACTRHTPTSAHSFKNQLTQKGIIMHACIYKHCTHTCVYLSP